MKRLKVGYVVKRFPRASETFIAQEILELERQGAEVSIFTLWPNDRPAAHGWLRDLQAEVVPCGGEALAATWKRLHALSQQGRQRRRPIMEALRVSFEHPSRRGRHRLQEATAVAMAARERGVRHLHAHFANAPALVAFLAGRIEGLPFSFTAHAKDIYAKALPDRLFRRVVEASAFGVTVTEDNRRHLAERLGQRLAPRVLRLYNGVDLEAIRPTPRSEREIPRVLTVARLVEKKGIDTLLTSLHLLAGREVPFECRIVGDGPERPDLEARLARLGLGERVTFLGARTHEEVVGELQKTDLFVLPCRVAADGDRDALPTVLLEAMAAGVPCVSTDVGGVREIIRHRETGTLIPAANPLWLADATGDLLADPEARRTKGLAGRRRAQEHFDRSRNVSSLYRWFASSASGRRPREIADRHSLRLVEI